MSWQAPGYAHRLDLGGGRTGRAVLAVSEETGDLVVIRYLSVESTQFERVQTEITELSTVESEYFVGVREVIHHDEGIALVTDAVNGANLRHILRETSAGIGAEAALLVYYESLNGMVAAHAGGVTHGDYRPENVIISTDGAVRMIDARAAAWTNREITLGTGVYLAPERWRGTDLNAGADVYAATVTLVEMLVGEPPYWEDSQLLALRYRHEQEEIPADGIPVELRDVVRLGLAKDADHRGEAFALLELVNLSAIAEFGSDWMEVGRAQLVSLVGDRGLGVGGVAAIEETEMVAAGELVELDDYYTDQAAAAGAVAVVDVAGSAVVEESAEADFVVAESADEEFVAESAAAELVVAESAGEEVVVAESAAAELVVAESTSAEFVVVDESAVVSESENDQAVVGAIAAAEVVAAAAEIVELARIEEMAAVESLVGAEEDVLTEEEERAVAEVSEIVVAVEAAAEEDAAVVGVAAVGGTAIAATDAELDEFDEVVAAEGVVFESVVLESESAAGAFGEGSVAAGLIAEGVSVEAEAEAIAVAQAEAVAIAEAEAAEAEEEEEAAAVVAAGIVAGLVAAEAAEAAAVAVPPEEIAVGVAAVPPQAVVVGMASVPPEKVAVGVAPVPPFHRRHPWFTGIAAILLIILCAGGTLAWTGHFPGSPGSQPTPIAALTETPTQGDVVPPATGTPTPSPSDTSNGGVPVTSPSPSSTPTGPTASPSSSGGTSTSTAKPSESKHPKPSPSISKLPVTGAKTTGLFGGAVVLILLGGGLLILGRRRRG